MKRIINILGSMKTALILLLLYAIALGLATFIESSYNTETARKIVYHNYAFMALQFLMVLSFCAVAMRHRLWKQKRYGVLIFHVGLITALIGALTTHIMGYEGYIHVRKGYTMATMTKSDGQVKNVPFEITLNEFRLTRYPGSSSPSAFDSFLTIKSNGASKEVHVSTNKIYSLKGYRLFQTSYDMDENGTVLTANYDPMGMWITYTGYLLLLVGMVLMPLNPQSRLRVLSRNLGKLEGKGRTAALIIALSLCSFTASAASFIKQTVPVSVAKQMGELMVQTESGRIEPLDTYANKLLRKVYRGSDFNGLTPVQVVAGFMLNPEQWMDVPIIRQKNKELQDLLDYKKGDFMTLYDMFDNEGIYRLNKYVEESYLKPASERTKLDKDILKTDEKADIVYMLSHGMMMRLFPLPNDKAGKWYSTADDISALSDRDSMFVTGIIAWLSEEATIAMQTGNWEQTKSIISMISTYQASKTTVELPSTLKIKLELFYNKARIFFYSAMGYMTLGLLTLGFVVVGMFRRSKFIRYATITFAILIGMLFLFHTAGIAMRWYFSGQPPSNGYEMMIYVGWVTALAGLIFARRSLITMSLTTFLSGIILFVANLNFMDPEITPLVPVLNSPWLMIHVSVITASYGFFAMCFLLGVVSLCFYTLGNYTKVQYDVQRLRTINEIAAIIGLCLLTAGTFIGAIWANESWGRYWGWDPKETWALVTMVVYAAITHSRLVPKLASDYAFSVMTVFGLSTVLMTYFGVNYYLVGLHSYGGGDTPPAINVIFVVYAIMTLLAIAAGVKIERSKAKLGQK